MIQPGSVLDQYFLMITQRYLDILSQPRGRSQILEIHKNQDIYYRKSYSKLFAFPSILKIYFFLNAENPSIFIGTPVLLFKGIITTANYKEEEEKAVATWGIKSHWGDFQQVRGRLTSDDFHRAYVLIPLQEN